MSKIRLVWDRQIGASKPEGQGKWIPDTEKNREVLMQSLQAFNTQVEAPTTCFWLEVKASRRQRPNPVTDFNRMISLPWWNSHRALSPAGMKSAE